jgi:O-antigen ligase
MVRAHPWFGLGPEVVNLKFKDYLPPDAPKPLPSGWYGHLHNTYLQYAAERGVPALLVLLWLVGKILWDFLGALRRLPAVLDDRRFLLHGAVAAVIGVLITGFFEYNLGDSEVLLMFLVAVSMGYTARE